MTTPHTRLSWLMALGLAPLGAIFPYMAKELRAWGVDGLTLTALMVMMPLTRVLLGPMWGTLADHWRDEARVLRWAALTSLLGLIALLALPASLAAVGLLLMIAGRAGIGPVLDGLTLRALGGDSGAYGKVRRWGSVGFLVAVGVAALLEDWFGLSPLKLGVLLSSAFCGMALFAPQAEPPPRAPLWPAFKAMLGDPAMRWLLVGAALHYAPHSIYDTWFTLHVEDLGLRPALAGVAVALGVAVEVIVLGKSQALLARFGAERLFVASALLAIPRWLLTAWATAPWLVIGLQASHGFTFGAFWVSAVALVSRRAPAHLTNSAQGLLGAAVGGVGAALGASAGAVIGPYGSAALFVLAAIIAILSLGVQVLATRAR
ncbi:MAG: MFS transporter [Deltaproteobacteria bacterium]|nr:MFS transporter [Deltaproteobacteria bacterium]